MKKTSFVLIVLILFLIIPLAATEISLEEIAEIADRNAQAIWGDVFPAEPIPYYGPDDEIIAYHFNYAIGKEFPDKDSLIEECRQAFLDHDREKQFGSYEYANLVIGAQTYMPVIIEYSNCLSIQYALGHKLDNAAEELFVSNYEIEEAYYFGPGSVWFCITKGNEKKYLNLEPKTKVKSELEFREHIESLNFFWNRDNFDEDWYEFLEDGKTVGRSTVYIPGHEEMPFLEWNYGCTPTSAAMLLAWWDNYHHFGNLIDYHLTRYDVVEIEYDHHVPFTQICLGNEMDTDESDEGSTDRDDICDGYIGEVEDRGYNCNSDGHWAWTWTVEELYDDLKAEINNNRPIHLSIPGHSIIGIGYNNQIKTFDVHDPNDPVITTMNRSVLEGTYWVVVSNNYGTYVNLNSPHGGLYWGNNEGFNEILESNDFFEINWASDNNPDYYANLYYQFEGGHPTGTWYAIALNTENDGIYDWLVPEISDPYYGDRSDYCRVKVEVYDSGDNLIASDGSYGNFTINPGGGLQELSSMDPVSLQTSPDYFFINHYEDTWGIVGAKNVAPTEFWYIDIFDDLEFSNKLEGSHSWEQVNYIVIDGNSTLEDELGVKVFNNYHAISGEVHFDGEPEILALDTTYNLFWPSENIVKMWDVHLLSGEYYFELKIPDQSDCDLDMALFKQGQDYYQTSSDCVAISDNYGDHVNEAFYYTPPEEGDYGLCIIKNNISGGDYELTIHNAGIWEGSVSSDWFDPANWASNSVPTYTTDVVIPWTVWHHPDLSTGYAFCDNITINDIAHISFNGGHLNVYGDMNIFGELRMLSGASTLTVENSIVWESGSSAQINDNSSIINCYRNWTFQGDSAIEIDQGTVAFVSENDSYITSDDGDSYFNDVEINKTSADCQFNILSQEDLVIKGDLTIETGSNFTSNSSNNIEMGDLFVNNGNFQFNAGKVIFSGNLPSLTCNSGDYFNEIEIATGTDCILLSDLYVEDALMINDGGLFSSDHDIYLKGDWENNVGPDAFHPGAGTIIFNGSEDQTCEAGDFNILKLDKPSGELIIPSYSYTNCNSYDWENGILHNEGQFTASDLVDSSILGTYILDGGQINLHQNAGQYIDINGSLIIYDGEFNITGGNDNCFFAHDENAYLYMEGGILDIKDHGIHFDDAHLFSHVVLGGTIRMARSFTTDRSDFHPEGGVIELYGSNDVVINFGPGNYFNDLIINKSSSRTSNERIEQQPENTRSEKVSLVNDLTVEGDLTLSDGTLDLNGHTLSVADELDILGTLKMQDPDDELNIGVGVTWQSGSSSDINNGNINLDGSWYFTDGTQASLGTGNTVNFAGTSAESIGLYDSDAQFGNIVVNKPASYVSISHTSTHDLRVAGDFTVASNSEFQVSAESLIVEGELVIEITAEMNMESGGSIICEDLTTDGIFDVGQGDVTIHNDFLLDTNGTLNLDGGSVIMDKAYTGSCMSFVGTLNLLGGYLEITNEGIQFGSGGTPNMTNGTIRVGWSFRALSSNAFHPTGGTIEFMGTGWSTIECNNGNYFYNLEVDKTSTMHGCMLADDLTINNDLIITTGQFLGSGQELTVGGDLTIEPNGTLDPSNQLVLIGGNWINNRGPSGFVEGSGTVRLFGPTTGIITTDETFHDLVLDKTTGSMYYTEIPAAKTVHIENDLHITDGKLYLYNNSLLDIDQDLIIADGAGLRCDAAGPGINIKIGRHFYDYNTDNADYTSFIPESSTVTFDGSINQVFDSSRPSFEFYDLIINQSADYFYPHSNIVVQGDLSIPSGCWNNHTTEMVQTFMGNVTFCNSGWWGNMGTAVFSGPEEAVYQSGGSNVFHNVIIDKTASRENSDGNDDTQNRSSETLHLITDLICLWEGDLTVSSGTLETNGQTITGSGNVTINGGKIALDSNSRLRVGNGKTLSVSNGGILESIGSAGNEADITCYNSGNYHDINIESGGTISAEYTIFQYLSANGVYVKSAGSVDEAHAFNNCIFQSSVSGGSLLRVENSQNLVISDAVFPTNSWGSTYNAYKESDQGSLEFSLATGDFSGESFEYDPYGRINWAGAPEIDLYTPYSLNFGDVAVGDSDISAFTIENIGGGTLVGTITTPEGFTVAEHTRPDSLDNRSRNTIPYSITSGLSTVFIVTFSPLLEQFYDGNIVITHNADGPEETLYTSGTGVAPPPPGLYYDPEILEFGDILIGQGKSISLLIENTGGSDLIGSITTPTGFSISEEGSRNTVPFDIPPEESMEFDVLFEPIMAQEYSADLIISHNIGEVDTLILCSGQGLGAVLTYDPASMDELMTLNVSILDTLTLGNDGNIPLEYLAYVEYEDTRTTIIYEGFESGFPPAGWSLEIPEEDYENWEQSDAIPNSGSYCALASPYGAEDARLITPPFTATDNCILQYWSRVYQEAFFYRDALFEVEVTTDGSNWTTLDSRLQENILLEYVLRGLTLADYSGQNIQIAFRVNLNYDAAGICIDDVLITGDPSPTYSWLSLAGSSCINDTIPVGRLDVETEVEFNSTGLSAGDYSADIKIISNDITSSLETIPVTLSVGFYDMTITPTSLDFGEIEIGLNDVRQFTIENTGTCEINGEVFAPDGFEVWQDLPIRPELSEYLSRNVMYALSSGEIDTFNVEFEPLDTLYYDDVITISHNMVRDPETIQVTGSGVKLPGLYTYEIMQITTDSAVGGGEVLYDGNLTVSARGICWNTSSDPTLENDHTIDGAGIGEFISSLSSLDPDTPYYVRAYATNSLGTDYGNEVTFTTLSATPTITVSTTTLPDFGDVLINTNSSEQDYTVSGINLTDNITINSPTGFEISTVSAERSANRDFSSQIILSPVGGSVVETTIYTRFHPNATGMFSGNIIHSSSGVTTKNVAVSGTGTASDLEITAVIWSDQDPYICDEISADVTITNNGNAASSACYLDLYYDLTSPPASGDSGDRQLIISSIPAGGYTIIPILQVWNDTDGSWNTYLQLDTENTITESNEENNIWGADLITWNSLPAVENITIEYNLGTIQLTWTYPIYCDSFNIYKSLDPYDFSAATIESSTVTSYSDIDPPGKFFYRVKAVRNCTVSVSGN